MKVFISADIEGITTTTTHDECTPSSANYGLHAQQMTREVLAACEGAFKAGATEIVIKDAHGPALNIDPTQIPENVILQRSWTGHPYSMAYGIDGSFDAAMFIGYHSPAGAPGNPLSHTMTGRPARIRLNGRSCPEFMLYSWACALEGVPTVFLSGDRALCESEKELHPGLHTVAVKDGLGSLTRNYSPAQTIKAIRETAERALRQDLSAAKINLPGHFEAEIFFKEQWYAERVSYFPGVQKRDSNTIVFETDDYFEVLRTLNWIL